MRGNARYRLWLRCLFGFVVMVAVPMHAPATRAAIQAGDPSTSTTADYVLPQQDALLLADTVSLRSPAIKPQGTYQVDVVAISTPMGTPVVTREMSEKMIRSISQAFESVSNGSIKLMLRNVNHVKVDYEISTPVGIGRLVTTQPVADAGYSGLIYIGVRLPNPAMKAAGTAVLNGAETLINFTWNMGSRGLVMHEISHLFGILHVDAVDCTRSAGKTNCTPTPGISDTSDLMGGYRPAFTSDDLVLRYHAWHLLELGFLSSSSVREVHASGVFDLAPVYGGVGLKLLKIPAYGELAYTIEYRPAAGPDAFLAGIGMAGVQVRAHNSEADPLRTMLPSVDQGERKINLVRNGTSVPFGLNVGASITLPDDTLVQVLSATPDGYARISITMPSDNQPPDWKDHTVGWYSGSPETSIEIVDEEWVPLGVRVDALTDNREIASVTLEVDGKIVAKHDRPGRDEVIAFTPREFGTFAARAIARDHAGNEAIISSTLTSRPFINKAMAYFIPLRKSPSTLELHVYEESGISYKVTDLSAGKLGTIRRSDTGVIIPIRGLKPGQRGTLTLTGSDRFGYTDGGQVLRFRLPKR